MIKALILAFFIFAHIVWFYFKDAIPTSVDALLLITIWFYFMMEIYLDIKKDFALDEESAP